MHTNGVENCTYPVPQNQFGIFAMHCQDNVPIGQEDLKRIIGGPAARAEPELHTELAKPLDLSVSSR